MVVEVLRDTEVLRDIEVLSDTEVLRDIEAVRDIKVVSDIEAVSDIVEERYNPFTGRQVTADPADPIPAAAALGLEPPRYCEHCGRRMIVQVNPDGWWAKCSRHGTIDSASVDRR